MGATSVSGQKLADRVLHSPPGDADRDLRNRLLGRSAGNAAVKPGRLWVLIMLCWVWVVVSLESHDKWSSTSGGANPGWHDAAANPNDFYSRAQDRVTFRGGSGCFSSGSGLGSSAWTHSSGFGSGGSEQAPPTHGLARRLAPRSLPPNLSGG